MDDKAHARGTDPLTSHDAADAATQHLKTGRAAVAAYARRRGPDGFTDAQMHDDLADPGSGLRSRRNELTAMNVILDSGRTARYGNAHDRIVWVHRDFILDAPAALERPPTRSESRVTAEQEAKALVPQLRQAAESSRREGRTGVELLFTTSADMIDRLLRA